MIPIWGLGVAWKTFGLWLALRCLAGVSYVCSCPVSFCSLDSEAECVILDGDAFRVTFYRIRTLYDDISMLPETWRFCLWRELIFVVVSCSV